MNQEEFEELVKNASFEQLMPLIPDTHTTGFESTLETCKELVRLAEYTEQIAEEIAELGPSWDREKMEELKANLEYLEAKYSNESAINFSFK